MKIQTRFVHVYVCVCVSMKILYIVFKLHSMKKNKKSNDGYWPNKVHWWCWM